MHEDPTKCAWASSRVWRTGRAMMYVIVMYREAMDHNCNVSKWVDAAGDLLMQGAGCDSSSAHSAQCFGLLHEL